MTKKLYEVPFTVTSEGRVLVMAEDMAQAKDTAEDVLGEVSLETMFDDNAIRTLKETTEIGDPVESVLDPTTEGFTAEDEAEDEPQEGAAEDPKAKA